VKVAVLLCHCGQHVPRYSLFAKA